MKNKKKKEIKAKRSLYTMFIKRFFDIIFSLLFIIILSPIYLFISLILALTLKEKIIFAQYRPGKNGKIFKLYKFKTMITAYDKNGNLLPDSDRVTEIGILLRKTALDELPQLFNILKGDMSFVGPRPRLVKDAVFYSEEALKAYSVRPGLTSPIQIAGGRSEATWEEIFESDLHYIQHISFFGDIWIIIKTAIFLIFSKIDGNFDGETKREYYYSDHLLKTKQITKKEYKFGLNRANEIIKENGYVKAYSSAPLVMAMSERPIETKQKQKKKSITNSKNTISETKSTKTKSSSKTTNNSKSKANTKSKSSTTSKKTSTSNTKTMHKK